MRVASYKNITFRYILIKHYTMQGKSLVKCLNNNSVKLYFIQTQLTAVKEK